VFKREAKMVAPVTRWMRSAGLAIKAEFVTPWGICDLVGLSFNKEKVQHRLNLRQKKSIGSITRAALLLSIPDEEEKKTTSLSKLLREYALVVPDQIIIRELERLIADHFVVRSKRGRLHKRNGWMPLQNRLVAIELKLSRIEDVMAQARNNLDFAEESYAALPFEIAKRVAANYKRWSDYFDDGVGLLGVKKNSCEVLLAAKVKTSTHNNAIQLYSVEKFWRTHILQTAEH